MKFFQAVHSFLARAMRFPAQVQESVAYRTSYETAPASLR